MRAYLLGLTIILGMFSRAYAEPSSEPNVTVLSYQELMRLSPEQRQTYMIDLRKLLVSVEQRTTYFEVAGYDVKELKEQIAELIEQSGALPEASAEVKATAPAAPDYLKSQVVVGGNGFECLGAGVVWDSRLGTCLVTGPDGILEVSDGGWMGTKQNCPINSEKAKTPITHYSMTENFSVCVPIGVLKKLSLERKKQIEAGKILPADFFDGNPSEQAKYGPDRMSPNPQAAKKFMKDGGVTKMSQWEETTGTKLKPEDVAALSKRDPTYKPGSKADLEQTDGSCAAKLFSCQDFTSLDKKAVAAIEEFRKDRSADSNVCMSGGFFSHYSSLQKKRGTCQIVTQFPPDLNPKKRPAFRCNANEALCNPILFCVGSKITEQNDKSVPVVGCVPFGKDVGYDITAKCKTWYDKELSKPTSRVRLDPKSAKLTDVKNEACDPGKMNNPDLPFLEEWNKLKNGIDAQFTKWCNPSKGSKGFQALYCGECKTIAAIRAKAKGGCADLGDGTPVPDKTDATGLTERKGDGRTDSQ